MTLRGAIAPTPVSRVGLPGRNAGGSCNAQGKVHVVGGFCPAFHTAVRFCMATPALKARPTCRQSRQTGALLQHILQTPDTLPTSSGGHFCLPSTACRSLKVGPCAGFDKPGFGEQHCDQQSLGRGRATLCHAQDNGAETTPESEPAVGSSPTTQPDAILQSDEETVPHTRPVIANSTTPETEEPLLRPIQKTGQDTGQGNGQEPGEETSCESQPKGRAEFNSNIRRGLLNDAGSASTSGKGTERGEENARASGARNRGRWVANKERVKRPGRRVSIVEKHLEAREDLSPQAASLLELLQTVDSDPERLAILEKSDGAQFTDADLLELLRRQRGYRTARLFFGWMEEQPGYRKDSPDAFHVLIAFAHRSQKMDEIPGLIAHMESIGVPFAAATYATLVEVYARTKQLEAAEDWFEKMRAAERANRWRAESSAYRAMMGLYERMLKPSEAARVWRELVARRGVHTGALQTYNGLVDALGKRGRLDEAAELVEDMRARGIAPNTTTYNILINRYGKAGARHQALKLFNEMCRAGAAAAPDAVTYNTLISMHVGAEDFAAAAAVMQLLRESGAAPSDFTLNAMIRAYAKLGQAEGAWEVYQKFRQSGIAPSAVSYNSLLHLLACAGKADEAEKVLRHMEEGGTHVDEIAWNGLVNGHSKAGNYAKVLETFERLCAAGVSGCPISYTPAVDALFQLQRDDDAMEMFDEMRAAGVQPRSMTYGVMLIVCARNDLLGEAVMLLDEMRDRGVPPSDTHYITVVDGLVRAGRWEDAQKVYRAARDEGRAGAQLYACLVCGLEAQGRGQQAEELFQSMKAAGVDTCEVIYGSVIAALGRLGHYEDAAAAFRNLEGSDFQPKARTYSQIVSVYGKAGLVGPAEAAFQVAARAGEADMRVHNALADVYLRGGLYQEAEEWYQKMEEDGMQADEATCRTFLVRYAEAGLWKPASRWLKKTMSSNFLFEATTYNKVLRCFGAEGKFELTWMLFHIMKRGINAAKPIPSTYNTMIGIMGELGRYEDAAKLVNEMRADGIEVTEVTKAILRRIVSAANPSGHTTSSRREANLAIEALGAAREVSRFVDGEFVRPDEDESDEEGGMVT